METLRLEVKGIGFCGNSLIREQLRVLVFENFAALYFGAVRLGKNIPRDYWAPKRVQINDTRLHGTVGLKIAGGHHINDEAEPTTEQLRKAISDIQALFDAAAEDKPPEFSLTVTDKNQN